MEKGETKTSIKKKIRDTQRLLAKDELPETVRLTKERILRSLQRELQQKQHDHRSKKVAKKYRMVKFFERRKVSRKLKSRLRELATCDHEDKRAEIAADIQRLRKELNYIAHYPDGAKYIALYPSTDTTSVRALAERDELMTKIEAGIEGGELSDVSEPACQSVLTTAGVKPTVNESEKVSTSHLWESRKPSLGQISETGASGDSIARASDCTTGSNETEGTSDRCATRSRKRTGDECTVRPKKKTSHRPLAAVDQEPDSANELHLELQANLKEDDFFL